MRYLFLQLTGCLFFLHTSTLYAEENILNWVGCGISKKSYMTQLAKAYSDSKGIKINLQGGGATKGIRNVASSDADFGGSCRYYLPGNKLEKKVGFEPVAWDALAIITHRDNPVSNLSLKQIKQIYSGNITNWSEVGGNKARIKLFTRKGKISGVGYTIRSLIFTDVNKDFPNSTKLKSSGPIEKAVESDINAIAITGVSSARLRKVKILSLNNKQPNYDSIKKGDYVLYRPLYITYNPSSKNLSMIKDFIRFAHSRKGRRIMIENGVVPYIDALKLVMIQSRQMLESQSNSQTNITD
ncbi:Phosphate ABC transporter, periplasmic phosphate-binding protein PstS (TC 3.A.1.7.1) [hydrothermal vent metagenome]|uniref:Phosphate ABC transporter, periplasmic phosphate-binding protein PstS (TC 3.A.1.7.1) n=1 Tax=hydrothermal vent metagenome TaxID=652676 RepID=A0A3B0YCV0_9ZZZZ